MTPFGQNALPDGPVKKPKHCTDTVIGWMFFKQPRNVKKNSGANGIGFVQWYVWPWRQGKWNTQTNVWVLSRVGFPLRETRLWCSYDHSNYLHYQSWILLYLLPFFFLQNSLKKLGVNTIPGIEEVSPLMNYLDSFLYVLFCFHLSVYVFLDINILLSDVIEFFSCNKECWQTITQNNISQ